MLDRTTPPLIHNIDTIHFERPSVLQLTPHCQLLCMSNVQNETSKFELLFDAGTTKTASELASLTNGLLLSGTAQKNAIQINAEIDQLGGFIEHGIGMETASISMYALKEHLFSLAKIVFHAINDCVFDQRELTQHLQDREQKLNVSLGKVNVLAQRLFKQNLFANAQNYKHITEAKDFENIHSEDLQTFHRTHYLCGLRRIVLVGNFSEQEIEVFATLFRAWAINEQPSFEKEFVNNKGSFHHEKKDALQTAIRIGVPLFNKTHPDYIDFTILNTILGDYFGSRLMKNIREDKGYTYGIASMIPETECSGYWMIGTEVSKDVKEQALTEIRREIETIQQNLVEDEELDLVKNYLIGQLLKSADGPYAMMDLYLDVEAFGMDMKFYDQMIHSINEISPERLQQLAQKYLNWNDLTIVTAG